MILGLENSLLQLGLEQQYRLAFLLLVFSKRSHFERVSWLELLQKYLAFVNRQSLCVCGV